MTDTGIFKVIWRINAVLVLIAGIGVCWLLMGEAVEYLDDRFAPAHALVEAEDTALKLGYSRLVGNGAFYLLPYSPGGRWVTGRSLLGEQIRNFLIVDAKTNESHWMFPDFDHRIIDWDEITRNADCGVEGVGVAIVDVPADTNGDGRLDDRDMTRRLVSAGFRHEPRDIVGEPVHFLTWQENEGRLFCEFSTDRGRESAVFVLDEAMTLVDRRPLPLAPADDAGGVHE